MEEAVQTVGAPQCAIRHNVTNLLEGLDIRSSSPKAWHYGNIQKVLNDLENIDERVRNQPIWSGAKRCVRNGTVTIEYIDVKTGGDADPYVPETLAEFCDVVEAIATGRVDYAAAALAENVPEVAVIQHSRATKRPKCDFVEQALKINTYWDVNLDGDITQLVLSDEPVSRFQLVGDDSAQYSAGSCIGSDKLTILTGNQSPEQNPYELEPVLEINEGGKALEDFIQMLPDRSHMLHDLPAGPEILNFKDQITKIIEYQYMHKYVYWPMSAHEISALLNHLDSMCAACDEYSPELVDQLMEDEIGLYQGRSGQIHVTETQLDPRFHSPGYLFRRIKPQELPGMVESIECPFLP